MSLIFSALSDNKPVLPSCIVIAELHYTTLSMRMQHNQDFQEGLHAAPRPVTFIISPISRDFLGRDPIMDKHLEKKIAAALGMKQSKLDIGLRTSRGIWCSPFNSIPFFEMMLLISFMLDASNLFLKTSTD